MGPNAYGSITNLLKMDTHTNFDLNDKSLQANPALSASRLQESLPTPEETV